MVSQDALHIVSTGLIVKLLTPTWLLNLASTQRIKEVKVAFAELDVRGSELSTICTNATSSCQRYMREMINSRRSSEKKDERHDLLSSLLDASEDGTDGQSKITDEELLGKFSPLNSLRTIDAFHGREHIHLLTRRFVVSV